MMRILDLRRACRSNMATTMLAALFCACFELARDFKCGKDEVKVIGESGRAVELAKRR